MNRSLDLFRYSVLALAASTALVACNDNNDPRGGISTPAPVPAPVPPTPPSTPPSTPPAIVADTFALTSGNKLVGFAAATPGTVISTATLAVPATETLLGGDFRPADGLFYIVTRVITDNTVKVYTANTTTGVLGTAIPLLSNGMGGGVGAVAAATPITLTGTKVGVDFNPLANALRIIDNGGTNLRTTLAAGNNTFIDAPIPTGLAEAAYTNSFSTTCQTDLYYINGTQLLLTPAPNGVVGNAATARLVGSLGVTADNLNSGFDIRTTATGNTLIAALPVGGIYSLYTVSPTTGAATSGGAIGGLGVDSVLSLSALTPAAGAVTNTVGNMFALTVSGNLNTFNRPPQGSPARLCSTAAITGLTAGDVIVGADTRPATGALVALTKAADGSGALYTVSAAGAASGRVALNNGATPPVPVNLTGANFGVDFNPVPDRLRVVGNDGQNLRINVATGGVTVDSTLTTTGTATTRTGVTAAAYTNSINDGGVAQTSFSTALFGVDTTTSTLVMIGAEPATGGVCTAPTPDVGNPNCGVVTNVGTGLGVTIGASNGFEIDPRNGTAFLAGTVGTTTSLYTVDLGTGVATSAGNFTEPVIAVSGNGAVTATVFGVTQAGALVSFLPDDPATVTSLGTITGIGAGETIQGIDFRPSIGPKNGTLVAVTTTGAGVTRLYTVNPTTAAATSISTLSDDTAAAPVYAGVTGAFFGVDFNPLPDRLRIVSNTSENLRVNVESGAAITDGNLSVAGIFAAGYTNSFSATASTALYYLGNPGGNTMLYTTAAPNAGTLSAGLNTTVAASSVGDIDIAGGRGTFGIAMAVLQPAAGGAAASGLYRLNLATGAATKVGADIGGGSPLIGMAIRLQ